MSKIAEVVLAVDLGGTNLRVALVTRDNELIAFSRWQTQADRGPRHVIRRLLIALKDMLNKAGSSKAVVNAIIIAVAGAIDIKNGVVTTSPHLSNWRNVQLRNIVFKEFGISASIINDANAAAIGEYHCGVGKGKSSLIYIGIGTGIGAGIILNGQLYEGADGAAGEIGHLIIKEGGPVCSCGNRGCLEALVSGYAIQRDIRDSINAGRKTMLLENNKSIVGV